MRGEAESRQKQKGRGQADGKVGHSSPSCVLKLRLGLMTDMSQKVLILSETDAFLIVFSKENTEGSSSEYKPKNIQARRDVSFCLRARSVFGSPFKVSVRRARNGQSAVAVAAAVACPRDMMAQTAVAVKAMLADGRASLFKAVCPSYSRSLDP